MSDATTKTLERTAQCLCGGVKFSARLKNGEVGVCHCSMCRRWSGGIFLSVEAVGDLEFERDDALGVYTSSDWGERCFCSKCGSTLFWRMRNGRHTVVSAQALDDLPEPRLSGEIFFDEKPDYYNFAEATRKMTGAEVFAMYAPKAD